MGEVTSQCRTMDLLFQVPDLTKGDQEMKEQTCSSRLNSASPFDKLSCINSIPNTCSIPFNDVRSELLEKGSQLSQMWSDLVSTLMKYQAGLVSMEVKLAAGGGSNSCKPKLTEKEDCACGGNGNCANTETIRRIQDEMSVKDRLLLKCQRDLLSTEERLTETQKDLADTKEHLKQSKSELRSKNERLSKLEVDVQKLHEKVRVLQSEANTKDLLVSKLQSEMVRDNGELTMEINKLKMSFENEKQHLKIEIGGLKRTLEMERRAHDDTRKMYREAERKRSIDGKSSEGSNPGLSLLDDEDEVDAMELDSEDAGRRSRSSSDADSRHEFEAQDLTTHGRDTNSESTHHSTPKNSQDGEFKFMTDFLLPMSTPLTTHGYETPPSSANQSLPLMAHSGNTSQALHESRLSTSVPGTSSVDIIDTKFKIEGSSRGSLKVPLSLTPLTGIYRTGLGNSRFRHKSGVYRCTDCGNTYNHSSSLSRHRLVHRQQHMACSWCNESFSKYIHLMQHRKICQSRNSQNSNEYVMKLLSGVKREDEEPEMVEEKIDEIFEEGNARPTQQPAS